MTFYSKIPPKERDYSEWSRLQLSKYEAQLVEVKARVKEFRNHKSNWRLNSVLLINVEIFPIGGNSFEIDHLWVLESHLRQAGIRKLRHLTYVRFLGTVYAYKQRNRRSHKFGILPVSELNSTKIKLGMENRYGNEASV